MRVTIGIWHELTGSYPEASHTRGVGMRLTGQWRFENGDEIQMNCLSCGLFIDMQSRLWWIQSDAERRSLSVESARLCAKCVLFRTNIRDAIGRRVSRRGRLKFCKFEVLHQRNRCQRNDHALTRCRIKLPLQIKWTPTKGFLGLRREREALGRSFQLLAAG